MKTSHELLYNERTELLQQGIFVHYMESQAKMMLHFYEDLEISNHRLLCTLADPESREVLAEYILTLEGDEYKIEQAIENSPDTFDDNFESVELNDNVLMITTKPGGSFDLQPDSITDSFDGMDTAYAILLNTNGYKIGLLFIQCALNGFARQTTLID